MTEKERRDGLSADVARIRAEATAYRDKIKDEHTKTFLVPIFNTLNDMDSVFLNGKEPHAPWWYDAAEIYVRGAAKELQEIIVALDSRGGPDKAVFRG
jgi:hypothetical protein